MVADECGEVSGNELPDALSCTWQRPAQNSPQSSTGHERILIRACAAPAVAVASVAQRNDDIGADRGCHLRSPVGMQTKF